MRLARRTTADRMAAHQKSDQRRDGLCAGRLLFPRNAKTCREAIRAGIIYYCSQAFYPKGITNAWLGNAWGGHLQISPVIARIFFSPNFIRWGKMPGRIWTDNRSGMSYAQVRASKWMLRSMRRGNIIVT